MNAGPTQLYRSVASDVLCDVAVLLDSPLFLEAMNSLRVAVADMSVAEAGAEADRYQERVHMALDRCSRLLAGDGELVSY